MYEYTVTYQWMEENRTITVRAFSRESAGFKAGQLVGQRGHLIRIQKVRQPQPTR